MSQGITSTQNNSTITQDYNNFTNYFPFSLNEQEKRKILPESCNHCQKARLTCDGGRPCQGCIKRDLMFTTSTILPFTPADQPIETSLNQFMDNCTLFNFSLNDLGFGSETAGLEYGVLGNMIPDKQDFSPIFSFQSSSSPATTPTSQQPSSIQQKSTPKRDNHRRKSRNTENVYNSVQKPFNYAEGFHYLIQYVTEK
ncbi:hypothetical protein RO3G_03434 [Rhizopus delemar RA 99-880]|uniref:Zn(2)-C6 fungal-type domain-containing protein n=1 Tax=Rhizopus delemar (strain RA 99-880 / ATCC MYA-4621 / FGSC 9543 / NRRL 43880) TaxID=246409 RepID=I1BR99_RHIO9|nr:hypothetical protein RO3G_03434 [Rhizopus delemar RA 99-880]|eukprot:EIE78729.1 hypothetical protein RO3G_03434 [Rhizopus delemar RA 99-880]